jgi:deazaflavin-dependent oxidoreductase (nitroreductase family)
MKKRSRGHGRIKTGPRPFFILTLPVFYLLETRIDDHKLVRADISAASKICKEITMIEVNERNKKIIDEFRANDGKVGGYFAGRTLLLLHTKGAKSGQERIKPVAYVRDGDRLVVIASKGGAPTNPNWYHNVVANPLVTVVVGQETFQAQATVSEEPERTRLYNKMVEMMPGFDDYRRKTTRIIPVIVLTPVK